MIPPPSEQPAPTSDLHHSRMSHADPRQVLVWTILLEVVSRITASDVALMSYYHPQLQGPAPGPCIRTFVLPALPVDCVNVWEVPFNRGAAGTT